MVGPLYTTDSGLLYHAGKIIIVAVGLPARGKTHICRALERYLRWCGVKTQVISLGDFRRKTVGGAQQLPPDYFTFGEKSAETAALRDKVKTACEELIIDFFNRGGQVAIYDANNGTRAARQKVAQKFASKGIHVVFLESICNNRDIIEANIRSVKISSPDYKHWLPERAVADYWSRIKDHEKYYETVDELDWPSIRIFDVGDKIIVNNIQGYLQTRIVFFLMNIHNRFRIIYFARSGQSLIEHSYKADSDLSPAGWEYADRLREAVIDRRAAALRERGLNTDDRRLVIWTSTRRRSHHTAWPFVAPVTASPSTLEAFPHQVSASIDVFAPTPPEEKEEHLGSLAPDPTVTPRPSRAGTATTVLGSGVNLVNSPAPTGTYVSTSPRLGATDPSSQPQQQQSKSVPGSPSRTAFGLTIAPSRTSNNTPAPPMLPPPAMPLPNNSLPPAPLLTNQSFHAAQFGPPSQGPRVKVIEKAQMLEINPGVWDGLSPEDAKRLYPEEYERFVNDPYSFRAPRAESYHDLSVRLEPILIELEREQEDLLIIGHASVIRCLLAYLIGLPASEVPAIEVARGDLIEVVPTSYGVRSQSYHFWNGPGREEEDDETDVSVGSGSGGRNFYENYAEDTTGKRRDSAAGDVDPEWPEHHDGDGEDNEEAVVL